MEAFLTALDMVLDIKVIAVVAASAAFGLLVGAIPGLTATMAIALLIPVTFFMEPVAAMAAIVTTAGMAIFAGDLPGALLRIPGTPASAAYTDDAYGLTRKGRAGLALGAGLSVRPSGGYLAASSSRFHPRCWRSSPSSLAPMSISGWPHWGFPARPSFPAVRR